MISFERNYIVQFIGSSTFRRMLSADEGATQNVRFTLQPHSNNNATSARPTSAAFTNNSTGVPAARAKLDIVEGVMDYSTYCWAIAKTVCWAFAISR